VLQSACCYCYPQAEICDFPLPHLKKFDKTIRTQVVLAYQTFHFVGTRMRSQPSVRRLQFRPQVEQLEKRECFAGLCNVIEPLTVPSLRLGSNATEIASLVSDDRFEQNDSIFQATSLGTLNQSATFNDLVLADSDWYRFELPSTGTSSDTVQIGFNHAAGDIDMALYNASGRLVAQSQSTSNRELISLANQSAGNYYLQVYGYRGATNGQYNLGFSTASRVVDDRFEQNDTISTAANLGTVTQTLTQSQLVLADAHDWFQFTTTASGTSDNYVQVQFANNLGDVDLEVYNAAGQLVGRSESTGNSERISLQNLGAGTYYVHVYGYRGVTNPNYTLTVNAAAPITNPQPPVTGGFDIAIDYTGLTVSQQAIFEQAAQRWERAITGDLPNASYNGRVVDDLLISAQSTNIDGRGGVLGQAAPQRFRSGSSLPYYGFMQFDTADLAEMERNGTLFSVIVHEMGHVLGIGTLWERLGLLRGLGTSNPIFVGPQATAAYNALFQTSAIGVPVESDGGPGTRDAHWDESIFVNELMSGYINSGTGNPLSRISIASLADMGYSVNLAAADSYSPPNV
jgi:Leishmanolysin/Bacterial pre-peptidase C-terminal domain